MSGQHARIAPSSAPIWGKCSGYLAVAHLAADTDTDATLAGTAAHWVFAETVLQGLDADDFIGQTDPDGTVIDKEMADGAQHMVDMVRADLGRYTGGTLLIEQRVDMPDIHAENWGTFDYAYVLPEQRTVILGDYKHGHLEVSPVGNLQLVDYLKGLENFVGHTFEGWTIELRICQPYAYSPQGTVKHWQTTRGQVVPLWQQLREMAHADPHMTTGSHCNYCPLLGRCSAARQAGYTLVNYLQQPFVVDTMDGKDLAAERDVLMQGKKLLEKRLADIEDQLFNRVKQGEQTGLTMRVTQGRAKWKQPVDVVIATMNTLGVDVSKTDAKTPTQAEALAKTPEQKKALAALSHRPNGKAELIKTEDSLAFQAFSQK